MIERYRYSICIYYCSILLCRTALLLSQAGGGGSAARLVQDQLDRWAEVGADRHIDTGRLGLYSLVAGQPVQTASSGTVNTCHRLDWLRSLAHHLWYASISNIFVLFLVLLNAISMILSFLYFVWQSLVFFSGSSIHPTAHWHHFNHASLCIVLLLSCRYLTHPLASVSDALEAFNAAWQGTAAGTNLNEI